MEQGIVDSYSDTGGYGFIESDAFDDYVFFHTEDVGLTDIEEGDRVRFAATQAEKGPQVSKLELLDNSESEKTGAVSRGGTDVQGTVDFFNDTGGYGFIEADNVDEDVFFHMEDIGGPDLEEGQRVTIDVVFAEKGPRAENLRRGWTQRGQSPSDSETGSNQTMPASSSGDTEIYNEDQNGETEIYNQGTGSKSNMKSNKETLSFCPSCGADLREYQQPTYCMDCGTEL